MKKSTIYEVHKHNLSIHAYPDSIESFSEVLERWMHDEDLSVYKDEDVKAFLTKIKLSDYISVQQFKNFFPSQDEHDLALRKEANRFPLPQALPGKRLLLAISSQIPSCYINSDNNVNPDLSSRILRNMAQRFRRYKLPVIEITDAQLRDIRTKYLQASPIASHREKIIHPDDKTNAPSTLELQHELTNWAKSYDPNISSDDILGMVKDSIARSHKHELLQHLSHVIDIPKDKLESWIEAHVLEKPGNAAGLYLKALRKFHGYSQPEFAKRMGVHESTVVRLEQGHVHTLMRYIPDVIRIFNLNEKESSYIKNLAAPDLLRAFDSEWLDQQPPEKQAGLLLAAHRHNNGWTRKQCAQLLGVNVSTIAELESGKSQALANYVDRLANIFDMDKEQREEMEMRCTLPVLHQEEPEPLPTTPPASARAFDAQWLDQQPPDKQAGLLLRAYREQAGMSRPELATQAKLSVTAIFLMENGTSQSIGMHIFSNKLPKALGLNADQTNYLSTKATLSLRASKILKAHARDKEPDTSIVVTCCPITNNISKNTPLIR